jgi:hypothetical protein
VTPLLFETIYFDTRILFALEVVSRKMQVRLKKAIDFIHTMIEELYDYSARDQDYS